MVMKIIYFLSLIIFYVITTIVMILLGVFDIMQIFDDLEGWVVVIVLFIGIGFTYFMGIREVVQDIG